MRMKILTENWILHRVQVSTNLCFHCAKFEVDKHQFNNFYEENSFKLC